MKYILLIHETPANFEARQQGGDSPYIRGFRDYYHALLASGAYVSGAPLKAGTGTTVRLRSGKRHVQDGPFAETKEQLGGFMILELPSLEAAIDWAARCPAAATGSLEVRLMDVDIHDAVVEP